MNSFAQKMSRGFHNDDDYANSLYSSSPGSRSDSDYDPYAKEAHLAAAALEDPNGTYRYKIPKMESNVRVKKETMGGIQDWSQYSFDAENFLAETNPNELSLSFATQDIKPLRQTVARKQANGKRVYSKKKFRPVKCIQMGLMSGLAFINTPSGNGCALRELYAFVVENFIGFQINKEEWKKSIRHSLCTAKDLYVKDEGDGNWKFHDKKLFLRKLEAYCQKKPDHRQYGLKDPSTWKAIKEGRRGIPEVENKRNRAVGPRASPTIRESKRLKAPQPSQAISPSLPQAFDPWRPVHQQQFGFHGYHEMRFPYHHEYMPQGGVYMNGIPMGDAYGNVYLGSENVYPDMLSENFESQFENVEEGAIQEEEIIEYYDPNLPAYSYLPPGFRNMEGGDELINDGYQFNPHPDVNSQLAYEGLKEEDQTVPQYDGHDYGATM